MIGRYRLAGMLYGRRAFHRQPARPLLLRVIAAKGAHPDPLRRRRVRVRCRSLSKRAEQIFKARGPLCAAQGAHRPLGSAH